MKFTTYLKESKNVHMEHVEDLMFNEGVAGTRKAINFLRDIRDTLAGNSRTKSNFTVKWDGCVHEDTIILTDQGDMTIKEIVEQEHLWDSIRIYGFDLEGNNQPVFTELFAGNVTNGDKDWVEVQLEDQSTIKLTSDHEVHTNRGWIKAGELVEGDDITEIR